MNTFFPKKRARKKRAKMNRIDVLCCLNGHSKAITSIHVEQSHQPARRKRRILFDRLKPFRSFISNDEYERKRRELYRAEAHIEADNRLVCAVLYPHKHGVGTHTVCLATFSCQECPYKLWTTRFANLDNFALSTFEGNTQSTLAVVLLCQGWNVQVLRFFFIS